MGSTNNQYSSRCHILKLASFRKRRAGLSAIAGLLVVFTAAVQSEIINLKQVCNLSMLPASLCASFILPHDTLHACMAYAIACLSVCPSIHLYVSVTLVSELCLTG